MPGAFTIFVFGITGVFIGMGMLYFSIKATGAIVDRLNTYQKESDKS